MADVVVLVDDVQLASPGPVLAVPLFSHVDIKHGVGYVEYVEDGQLTSPGSPLTSALFSHAGFSDQRTSP
eukprot:11575008-Prorocentrum_lima.AAC.1